MSRLLFHIGGTGVPDAVMLDYAMEQAETDPNFQADTHITFEDPETFFRVLTPARVRLLQYLHKQGSMPSVRALAEALGRDYANVHSDVSVLLENGLLEKKGTALTLFANSEPAPAEQDA